MTRTLILLVTRWSDVGSRLSAVPGTIARLVDGSTALIEAIVDHRDSREELQQLRVRNGSDRFARDPRLVRDWASEHGMQPFDEVHEPRLLGAAGFRLQLRKNEPGRRRSEGERLVDQIGAITLEVEIAAHSIEDPFCDLETRMEVVPSQDLSVAIGEHLRMGLTTAQLGRNDTGKCGRFVESTSALCASVQPSIVLEFESLEDKYLVESVSSEGKQPRLTYVALRIYCGVEESDKCIPGTCA